MKPITIFSDCHWNSKHPIKVAPEHGEDVYYLGDNHEFKNIKKKHVDRRVASYRSFLYDAENNKTNVLSGNHEVNVGFKYRRIYTIIKGKVLFVHGHRQLWSEEKAAKWETMSPGKGRFARGFSALMSRLRSCTPTRKSLSKKKIILFNNAALEHGCTTVIFGHTHPSGVIDETHDGIRIINVPRGKTTLIVDI